MDDPGRRAPVKLFDEDLALEPSTGSALEDALDRVRRERAAGGIRSAGFTNQCSSQDSTSRPWPPRRAGRTEGAE